jgi:glycosyltransferase involved in cell wall biosynthesis
MSLAKNKTTNFEVARPRGQRVVFLVNGIFGECVGGGDVFFYYMARAAMAAGYDVHFIGGHALKQHLERENLPLNLTLTDHRVGRLGDVSTLSGQFRLLWNYFCRMLSTLPKLSKVRADDLVYGVSEYWFDTVPVMLCRARAKSFHLGMMAPTLGEIIKKTRGDVTPMRLPSLFFWLSQQFSARLFRLCKKGIITYPHPEIKEYLKKFGHADSALWYIGNAGDVQAADRVPEQPKNFDAAWTGRVHPQKGIDDLLETFEWLKKQIPDFRAVVIGKSKDKLEPVVRARGLAENIFFSGLVSEEEKFRLLKSSRVFLMPSRYESWGIVVGEALAAGVPVVAYDLPCNRPVFGDFLRYVKCFDSDAFKQTAADEIQRQRIGENYLTKLNLEGLKKNMDWSASQESFIALMDKLAKENPTSR